MKKILFFLLALVFVIAGTANADLYTWEDESGGVHVTDYPPPQNLKKLKMKVHEESSAPAPAAPQKKKPAIALYTKNDCRICDKARDYLNARELTFTEYNLDEDEKALEKRKAVDGATDAPFAVIDGFQITGFSESAYNRATKSTP